MSGRLVLKFEPDTRFGAGTVAMSIPLSDHICRELMDTKPPPPIPGAMSFNDVVEVIKRREFRKELFVNECQRVGLLLAERMEDAEGWHDASRIEPAKHELSQGRG